MRKFSLGTFFLDGKYGDHFNEFSPYVNTYYAWFHDGYATSKDRIQDWAPKFQASCNRAINAGLDIYLQLGLGSNWAPYLALGDPKDNIPGTKIKGGMCYPFWDSIVRIDLADEPDWSQRDFDHALHLVKKLIRGTGHKKKPLGINYNQSQMDKIPDSMIKPLDFVSFEALVTAPALDSPRQHDAAWAVKKLTATVRHQAARCTSLGVPYSVVGMSYDRNYTPGHDKGWSDASTVAACQMPTYNLIKDDKNALGLNWFAYGRPGGMSTHPVILNECKKIGSIVVST